MKKKDILELFSENEEKVGLLYSIYSKKINADKKFWRSLAEEEIRHSKIIKRAMRKLQKRGILFEENKHSRKIIDYISKFIDQEIDRAKRKKVFSQEMLETALRLEQSMVENKCFEIFIPKNKEIQTIMQRLNRETKKHASILKNEIQRNGG